MLHLESTELTFRGLKMKHNWRTLHSTMDFERDLLTVSRSIDIKWRPSTCDMNIHAG